MTIKLSELIPEKIEPKYCPFCKAVGHEVFTDVFIIPESIRYYVKFWNCGAHGAHAPTQEEAVEKWNRRAEIASVSLDFSEMLQEDIQEIQRLIGERSSNVTILSDFTETERKQSVLEWIRYDGTPEKLPEYGRAVVIFDETIGYEIARLHKNRPLIWLYYVYIDSEWEFLMTVQEGVLWSYLPKLSEKDE